MKEKKEVQGKSQEIVSKSRVILSKIMAVLECIAGFLIAFVFGVTAISCIGDGETEWDIVLIMFILALIGVLLFTAGIMRGKLMNDLNTFLPILIAKQYSSLADIAATVGRSEIKVRKRLEKILRKGYIKNAYVDVSSGRFVFLSPIMPMGGNPAGDINNIDIHMNYVYVDCRTCGTVNQVESGHVEVCKFCGEKLKG